MELLRESVRAIPPGKGKEICEGAAAGSEEADDFEEDEEDEDEEMAAL